MNASDRFDDTSTDYEQLETERLAQDRDAARTKTADLATTTVQRLVAALVDADIVTPVPEERVFVHDPSDTTFESRRQLAVFHRGWTAARTTDEDDA